MGNPIGLKNLKFWIIQFTIFQWKEIFSRVFKNAYYIVRWLGNVIVVEFYASENFYQSLKKLAACTHVKIASDQVAKNL